MIQYIMQRIGMEEDYKKWITQFRKGYIELSVLLALKSKSMHGLALINFFNNLELKINEGTLYPLLNRMEQNGWLSSSWKIPEGKGHPKKMYILDKKGKELLPKLLEAYEQNHKILQNLKEL